DTIQIDEAFDKFTPLVLLVPKGDIAREDKLASELETLPNIKSIVSYTDAVVSGIPPEFLAESEREEFFSENYSRLVLTATTDSEVYEAFELVDIVKEIPSIYFGCDFYSIDVCVSLSY